MIGPQDRLALPAGVELRDDALHDVVRACSVPLNRTGFAVLGASTPGEAAAELERRYGVEARTALDDVLRFCADLNARLLLNVAAHGGRVALVRRWLLRLPCLLPLGVLPSAPTARRPVDTTRARSLARSAPRALGPFVALLLVSGMLVPALLLAAVGVVAPTLAGALGAAIAGSVLVHELAHLAALRGVPACVVTQGFRIAVVHRAISLRRTRGVAACGPVAGLVLAACLLAALWVVPSSELAATALVSLLNALGLTVLSSDGRALCGLR
jgi:hypothetical protein